MFRSRPPKYQTPETPGVRRNDHVWFVRPKGGFKCCICGCVTDRPPPFPTPDSWDPDGFELPLTPVERNLCPYVPEARKV